MDVKAETGPSIDELFEAHRGRVYNFCLRMVASRQAAEDLTQEIFLKGLESRYVVPSAAWLYAVARNHCIDFLRREKSWRRAWENLLARFGPSVREGYRVDADLVERHAGLRVLQKMAPRYRALLVMQSYAGLSYEEMAEALGTTVASIGPMLHRAHAQAARIMREEAIPHGR